MLIIQFIVCCDVYGGLIVSGGRPTSAPGGAALLKPFISSFQLLLSRLKHTSITSLSKQLHELGKLLVNWSPKKTKV